MKTLKVLKIVERVAFVSLVIWLSGTVTFFSVTGSRHWNLPYFWGPIGIGLLLVIVGSFAKQKTNGPILFVVGIVALLTGMVLTIDFRNSWDRRPEELSTETSVLALFAIAFVVGAIGSISYALAIREEKPEAGRC